MQDEPLPCEHEYPDVFRISAQGHEFSFLPDGVHRYSALLSLIENAEHKLEAFYYLFQDDDAGGPVRDALVEATKRGVEVTLVVDRFGTDAQEEFFQPIVDAGGSFCFFNPRRSRRYLIRNHQKMLIVDEKIALVGGFNVSEHYFKPPEENGWCDLGAIVEGPVVEDLRKWFALVVDWAGNPNAQFRAIRKMVREWQPGDGKVRLLVGGPARVPSNWDKSIKHDFNMAERVDMVMAYFSPPRSYRRLLRRVAERGKVRLMTAAKSDNRATIGAARATYRGMLRSGTQIYEFQPCKLHMKLIVVDDATYFGSANFDHRSIRLNLEMMLRVEDAELAQQMRCFIDQMAEASQHITPEVYREQDGLLSRLKWYAGWFLVSVVDYTVTRRLNF